MADATMTAFAALLDESKWKVVRDVPIFKTFPKTKVIKGDKLVELEVTEADLYEIALNAEKRFSETGTVGRLTPGHIKPFEDETKQPPIYGHPMNFKVGGWGPKNELAVLCDFYVKPENWEDFTTYPYRSPEYHEDRKEITGVALLKRDPKLDLGMLMFSGRGDCFYFAMDFDSPRIQPTFNFDSDVGPIDPTEPPMPVDAKQAGSEEVYPRETAAEGVPADWHGHFMSSMKHHYPHLGEMHKGFHESKLKTSEMSTMSTPTAPVTPAPAESDAIRMAREQMAIQFAQQGERIKALEAALLEANKRQADADAKFQKSELERQLIQFEATEIGIMFERASEVERMLPMTPEQRTKHLQYMRDYYKRDQGKALMHPVHQSFVRVEDSPSMFRDEDSIQMQVAELALKFQREKPALTWEQCMEEAEKKLGKKVA
jgi:hypothetical protein